MKQELVILLVFVAIIFFFIYMMDEIVVEKTLPDGTRYRVGGRKHKQNLLDD